MNKKQQIFDASLKLFVEFGFHSTPTVKIAQAAAVANGTLFHHFKTKDALVIGLYNAIKDELCASMEEVVKNNEFVTTKFKDIYLHTMNWAMNNQDKFYYLRQFELSAYYASVPPEIIWNQSLVLTQLINEGIKKKLLQYRPTDLVLALYNSQVFGVYEYLVKGRYDLKTRKEVVDESYEMLWEMLRFK